MAKCEILDAGLQEKLRSNDLHVRTCGAGKVDKNGIVSEYELHSLFITSDPA